jgi:hypothetical protein
MLKQRQREEGRVGGKRGQRDPQRYQRHREIQRIQRQRGKGSRARSREGVKGKERP